MPGSKVGAGVTGLVLCGDPYAGGWEGMGRRKRDTLCVFLTQAGCAKCCGVGSPEEVIEYPLGRMETDLGRLPERGSI